jgi:hypothetical protein
MAMAMATPQVSSARFVTSYHTSANPCFHGACLVRMADGSSKQVRALRRGDAVLDPNTGTASDVLCVVKTHCLYGVTKLVQLPGGLKITPYHPMRLSPSHPWQFPIDIGVAQDEACEAVYSFVLSRGHVMAINGFQCITFGHGVTNDPVLSHPYFGSQRIIEDLKKMPGWFVGIVEFSHDCMVRDASTGLLQGFNRECLLPLVEAQ